MASTKKNALQEQGREMVSVRGLRTEDVAVIVNGEARIIRHGTENLVEKRFADEFERAERAKDAFFENAKKLEYSE